ncbi:MAG: hypothetical protein GC154_00120 [bacterium]|nr:hypothetical protein [bacterium]
MTTTMFEAMLLERVETLERQNRRNRAIAAFSFILSVFLAGAAAIGYMGVNLAPGRVITAEKFLLTDSAGVIRAELSSQNDNTILAFYDASGTPKLSLADVSGDTGIHLYDERGMRQAAFGVSQTGPSLVFMTKDGNYQSGLITTSKGRTALFNRIWGQETDKKNLKQEITLDNLQVVQANVMTKIN